MHQLGKLLIVTGIILAVIGVIILLFRNSGIPFPGKLPGDIVIQRKNFTFYLLVATSIILSIILTLIFYFFGRR